MALLPWYSPPFFDLDTQPPSNGLGTVHPTCLLLLAMTRDVTGL